MCRAMPVAIHGTGGGVCRTGHGATGRTGNQLIDGEDRVRFVDARCAVTLTNDAPGSVRPPQMRGAVHPTVDCTGGLVVGAHEPLATRAANDLIDADWLIRPTLAAPNAVGAQAALAQGCHRGSVGRMLAANASSTACARRYTRGAGCVAPIIADRLMSGAVGSVAGGACAGVLIAGRTTVDVTRRNTMISAEPSVTDSAESRARRAGSVIMAADDDPIGRDATAVRAPERPVAGANKSALAGQRGTMSIRALEQPLGSLNRDRPLGELDRMHDCLDFMAPDLFRAPAGMLRFNHAACGGVRNPGPAAPYVLQHAHVVAVDAREFDLKCLICTTSSLANLWRQSPLKVAQHHRHQFVDRAC